MLPSEVEEYNNAWACRGVLDGGGCGELMDEELELPPQATKAKTKVNAASKPEMRNSLSIHIGGHTSPSI
jgi:hypothetical protein